MIYIQDVAREEVAWLGRWLTFATRAVALYDLPFLILHLLTVELFFFTLPTCIFCMNFYSAYVSTLCELLLQLKMFFSIDTTITILNNFYGIGWDVF